MTTRSQILQIALYSQLSGDSTLMALVDGLYDHVPEGSSFPYIVLSDMESIDYSTSSSAAEVIEFSFSIFSREEGKKQVQNIMGQMITLLHNADLSLSGGLSLINLRFVSSAIRKESDGRATEGFMRFRAVVEG